MQRLHRLLLLLVPVACSVTEAENATPFTVRDSAGVEVVESHGPLWEPGNEWRLSSDALVRIGAHRAGPEYELWQVTNVRRLDDGAIAVLNSGSNELRVYDLNGDHLRTYGKRGPGPGEFERAWGLQVNGDTLMVLDGPGSVAYFHRDAGFVRELSRAPVFDGPYSFDHLLPDGSASARKPIRPDGPPVGPYRPQFEIVLGTRTGDLTTYGVYGGILQERLGEGRERTSVVPPFAPSTQYHVHAAGSVVAVGDNAEYAFRIFDFDGNLKRVVRKATPLEPVTDSDVEAWRKVQRGLEWTKGQLPQLERLWREVTLPETKPAYGAFAFSQSGQLWVGAAAIEGEPVVSYSVFDERGVWLGDVEMPSGLRHWYREVDISDGVFVGVWADEAGLEEVRAYAIDSS